MNEHIADPLDRAVIEQEALLQEQLRAARVKQPAPLPFIGTCYNCHETLEDGHRFCDVDCRDDFEARKRSRAQKVY